MQSVHLGFELHNVGLELLRGQLECLCFKAREHWLVLLALRQGVLGNALNVKRDEEEKLP